MALVGVDPEPPTPPQQLRLIKKILRVLQGPLSPVPTPSVLRFQDVGLLFFLNNKQAQLYEIVSGIHHSVDSCQHLAPLRALVEFVAFIVGGLIVEAERIDEAVLGIRKQLTQLGTEYQRVEAEMQFQKQATGSVVVQTIAQHYRTRLTVPLRGAGRMDQLGTDDVEKFTGAAQQIQQLRKRTAVLRAHLKVLTAAQRLLHGSGTPIPEVEATAIVQQLDVLSTFRKAAHKMQDLLFDVPEREALQGVPSFMEFVGYLDCGLSAALEDLYTCELALTKEAAVEDHSSRVALLEARDRRNKLVSQDAIRLNERLTKDLPLMSAAAAAVAAPPPPLRGGPMSRGGPDQTEDSQQVSSSRLYTPAALAGPTPTPRGASSSRLPAAEEWPPAFHAPHGGGARPPTLSRAPMPSPSLTGGGGGGSRMMMMMPPPPHQYMRQPHPVDDMEAFFAENCAA